MIAYSESMNARFTRDEISEAEERRRGQLIVKCLQLKAIIGMGQDCSQRIVKSLSCFALVILKPQQPMQLDSVRKIMKTDFILTFERDGQEFLILSILPFESKQKMIGFCLGLASSIRDNNKLVKVSMCVCGSGNWKEPAWYKECNGKFWENDLKIS